MPEPAAYDMQLSEPLCCLMELHIVLHSPIHSTASTARAADEIVGCGSGSSHARFQDVWGLATIQWDYKPACRCHPRCSSDLTFIIEHG